MMLTAAMNASRPSAMLKVPFLLKKHSKKEELSALLFKAINWFLVFKNRPKFAKTIYMACSAAGVGIFEENTLFFEHCFMLQRMF